MTFEELLKIHNSIDVSPKHGRGTVYHYTSPEGLLGIITNKYIFATDLLYLNDAAEGSYALKLLLSVLEEDFSDRKVLYEGIKKEIDGLAKQAPNKYFTYVISFSKGEDLLNMWNYYTKGNSVEGYNVGFDITKLAHSLKIKIDKCEGIKEKDGLKVHHGAVNYDKKKQMGRIREIVHQFIDHFEDDETSTSYGEGVLYYLIVRKIYYLGLFYKAPEYKNEKEYRFVFVPGSIGKNNDWQSRGIPYKEEYRNKNGVLIPYQKCTFSSDSVVSIMCAPTNDFNRTEASLRRLLSYEFRGIQNEIHQSSLQLRY